MISVSLFLDRYFSKKNDGHAVKIRVYCSKKQIPKYVPTHVYQKKLKYTSKLVGKLNDAERAAKYCNDLGLSLDDSVEIIKNGVPDDKETEITVLKKRLSELQKGSGAKLMEHFDTVIGHRTELKMSTKHFEDAKTEWFKYLGPDDIHINDIDPNVIKGFIRFKKRTGCNEGGLSAYLRTTITVFKNAQDDPRLSVRPGNPFKGLIKRKSPKKELFHTPDDIMKLLNFKPKKGTTKKSESVMRRWVHIFIFQFCIGGHDFIEVANLKPSNIKNGAIRFERYKFRNRYGEAVTVYNPLNWLAEWVIGEYGNMKGERVFEWIPSPDSSNYTNVRNNYRKSINRSCELAGIDPLATKGARYLFRSFAGELGMADKYIDQIQGHKSGNWYQRRFSQKVIREKMSMVWDYVF